jgi:hypothetical protein
MLTYPRIATAAILLVSMGTTANAAISAKNKHEFIRAMESKKRGRKLSNMKEFEAELRGTSKQAAALRKKVFSKAKFVPPGSDRKLQNNYNNANANNVDYSSFNYDGAEDANANQNYYQQDGADDYFAVNGVWDNTFGFDPTQYSLSYHRCAEVRQFDDEIAAQEDTTSVFATKHFAVFRFCPEATCMGNKQDFSTSTEEAAEEASDDAVSVEDREIVGARGSGCQSNYGEYMIELQDYLEIMNEYRSERFQQYCTYCQKCMYKVYSVSLFCVSLFVLLISKLNSSILSYFAEMVATGQQP